MLETNLTDQDYPDALTGRYVCLLIARGAAGRQDFVATVESLNGSLPGIIVKSDIFEFATRVFLYDASPKLLRREVCRLFADLPLALEGVEKLLRGDCSDATTALAPEDKELRHVSHPPVIEEDKGEPGRQAINAY